MSDFDAYTDWLKISASRRPPTHYDLLGIAQAEADADRIYQAAMDRMAIVRRYHLGERAADALRLQNEISRALDCLRDPNQKRAYDEQLIGRTVDATASVTRDEPMVAGQPSPPGAASRKLPNESAISGPAEPPGARLVSRLQSRTPKAPPPSTAFWRRRSFAVSGAALVVLIAASTAFFALKSRDRRLAEGTDSPRPPSRADAAARSEESGVDDLDGGSATEERVPPPRVSTMASVGKADLQRSEGGVPPPEIADLSAVLFSQSASATQASKAADQDPPQAVGHGSRQDAPSPAVAPFDAAQAKRHQQTWGKYLGVPVEQTNSIDIKLTLIPPGEFTMGSPQPEIDALVESFNDPSFRGPTADYMLSKARDHFRKEGPQHPVELTQPFYLGTYEVTQQQYQDVMGVNPSVFSPRGDFMKGQDTSRHPVDKVRWIDAVDFCNKLSEREQLRPYYGKEVKNYQQEVFEADRVTLLGGTGYRLPTEAEWEYACRAGTTTPWSFGSDWQDLEQNAWVRSNSGNRTHRVGETPANPFGLFDLHGNLWEWCDPIDLPSAMHQRVLRGGSWNDVPSLTRAAYRRYADPTSLQENPHCDGFRVARTITMKGDESSTSVAGDAPLPPNGTPPTPGR
ncbi:MAG TPA: SUMF1/EgtB/PvdO family nonheme iron enzyme [Pirellulales bacterium]|nr:SUMF1/EgtB/PvdO family nonheme iron enzyme [Pirellulales bacterium]